MMDGFRYSFDDQAIASSSIASLGALFVEPTPVETQQKFLRFQLSPEQTALLAVDDITAVEAIALTEVLPVPHMPSCILGIYNWRGEMLWLVDLGQQVGLPSIVQPTSRLTPVMMIVLQINGLSIGLAVHQVYDIERHDSQQLYPPSEGIFSPQLLPFVQGYFIGDRTAVLSATTLLQDPLLQVHHHSSLN